jgi:hypothetical protein
VGAESIKNSFILKIYYNFYYSQKKKYQKCKGIFFVTFFITISMQMAVCYVIHFIYHMISDFIEQVFLSQIFFLEEFKPAHELRYCYGI